MPLVGAHEAEVADFDKTVRQDMLQIAPEKLHDLKTTRLSFFRFIIFVSKRNRRILMERQGPLIRHRCSKDVRRKILNHLPPVPRRFAVHHPFLIPDFLRNLQIEFRMPFLQSLSKQGSEPEGQRGHMHQKLLVFDLDPFFVILR